MDYDKNIFDWVSYINNYNDLLQSGMTTEEDAWNHWVNHGVKEGRIFYSLIDEEMEAFDWETYLNNYGDLKSTISTKEHAWFHWVNHGKVEGRTFYKLRNEEFEKFDWETYVKTYGDLQLSGVITKEEAWNHWINHGIIEERTAKSKNTTRIHCARFGNLFFLNMLGHFISTRNDIEMEYKYEDKYKELGIEFYSGKKTYETDFILSDDNFMNFMYENNKKPREKNIVFTNEMWCHNRNFCFLLEEYFKNKDVRKKVMNTNLFNSRYKNNNDLYVHVRLGDTVDVYNILTFEYYDKIISSISFDKGYISSDTIKSDICKDLIKKYKLNIAYDTDIHTIMFGSTCQHIVLSGGTFSWLIGFLGFFSNVYFPSHRDKVWYGDIFVFPRWKGVQSKDSIEITSNLEDLSITTHTSQTPLDEINKILNNISHDTSAKKAFLTPRNILPKVDPLNNIDLNDFFEEESIHTDSSSECDKNITEK
jgi:hypothetical protein